MTDTEFFRIVVSNAKVGAKLIEQLTQSQVRPRRFSLYYLEESSHVAYWVVEADRDYRVKKE